MARFSCVLCTLLLAAYGSAQRVIVTVTGGVPAALVNGKPAIAARLSSMRAVATDSAGNVYAIDSIHQSVLKITPAGVLTVVAGNGIRGFSGDGALATNASMLNPHCVAVDPAGNIYIGDFSNFRIRKVNTSGIMSTFAGNGTQGFAGDGGPATSANLFYTVALAVDAAGNVYVSDSQRVRKINTAGIISTIAGAQQGGFSGDGGPATAARLSSLGEGGLAFDPAGNLIIADSGNNRIRKVDSSGTISTIAGGGTSTALGDGGPATAVSLKVGALAVDSTGNIYFGNGSPPVTIRKVSPGGILSTVAGDGTVGFAGDGGPASAAKFGSAVGFALDSSGNLYVADYDNSRVREVSSNGVISTYAGNGGYYFSGDGGLATNASVSLPEGVALDAAGNYFIADTSNQRIRKVNPNGIISTVAGNGLRGFSGDGGPATSASLATPSGVAVDAVGNIYIADRANNRVRKVNTSGIISTLAGTGDFAFGGDGGPSTAASLWNPTSVLADANGNVYIADTGNGRVRKINPGGTISTVAGNGTSGYSGDGGQAIAAPMNGPLGIALAANGNLYISAGNAVRMVNSSGIISTVAGTGTFGFDGDNGPAINAKLAQPFGLDVDSAGNLYIADSVNFRVRVVAPGGIISTLAGGKRGAEGNENVGDGGPAIDAIIGQPFDVAVDPSGNVFIADGGTYRIRKVLASAPTIAASPGQIAISLVAGASANSNVALAGSVAGIPWTASTSTPWITLVSTSGTTPTGVAFSINTANLASGQNTGSITIASPLASPPTQTISVVLTLQATAASLSVSPATLNFQIQQTAAAQPQPINIANSGGGSLNWTVQLDPAAPWLTASAASGSASVGAPAALQAIANPAGLEPGTYSGVLQISSPASGNLSNVTVNLLVPAKTGVIQLSQSTLTFAGFAATGAVPAQGFGVLNSGSGSMSWTAQVVGSSPWLSLSGASGSSASSASPPIVAVGADTTNFPAGQYVGQIRIDAPNATNTPQFVTVVLNVQAPSSGVIGIVRPTGLIFVRQTGTSSPGSQNITISTASSGEAQAIVNAPAVMQDLISKTVIPSPLTISPSPVTPSFSLGNPVQVTVQPNLGTLGPGEYSGTITIGAGQTVQNVNVLFVVTADATVEAPFDPAGNPATLRFQRGPAATACPGKLYVTPQTIGSNFATPTGYGRQIRAQVFDDCGQLVSNATVIATFSTGDPPLALAALGNGIYEASWSPNAAATNVTITLRAILGTLTASVTIPGQVTGASQILPAFTNGASFAANGPLAPGSIISVFGSNLAGSTASASAFPIPSSLGGTQLSIAGRPVPLLYSSPAQVNALIPYDLPPNSSTQAFVLVNQSSGQNVTSPQTLTIAAARPGIFNYGADSAGVVTDGSGALLTASNPASAGQVVVIYCTGLGPVDQSIDPGSPAPGDPVARIVDKTIQVKIGGQNASVQFAGLTPGLVGLYQINAVIPGGLPSGTAQVQITQGTASSNSVGIPTK